jgi:ribosome-associated protein
MLIITPEISIEDKDITFGFIRASGPGGQNINKVSSAVQLRFDMRHSSSLPEKRLASLAGKKLADNGEIIIEAKRFRTQPKNREDAIKRLISLITKAAEKPKLRKKTKPSISASAARISNKKKRGAVKKIRSYNPDDWD